MKNSKCQKTDPGVMRLRSAELFFWQIESHLWESYSKYLLILIRQAHKNRKLVYFILGKLERLSYLTPKSHLNFLYALAICWGTENLPPEKERFFQRIQSEFPRKTNDPAFLEFLLLIGYDNHFNFSPLVGALLHRIDFSRMIGGHTDLKEVSICARSWFDLVNRIPDISQRRTAISCFKELAYREKISEEPRHVFGKTLVNLSIQDSDLTFQRAYLRSLEELSRKYPSDDDFQNIYSKGIVNHIYRETDNVSRAPYLGELYRLQKRYAFSDSIQEDYAAAIFFLALEEKEISEKRKLIRALTVLLRKPSLSPPLLKTAAQTFFNHLIDESSIQRKRGVLGKLEKLTVRTGYLPSVSREYARALVNLIVDDPNLEKRKAYLKILEHLALEKSISDEVALEYAKALMNFALCAVGKTERESLLVRLLEISEKKQITQNRGMNSDTRRDFLCIYAEGLALCLGIGVNNSEKLAFLKKIPPIDQIRKSEYFFVFADILREIFNAEKDWIIQKHLHEIMETVSKFQEHSGKAMNSSEQERVTRGGNHD